jgi:LysR family glycine cleavage system transcriptional activator
MHKTMRELPLKALRVLESVTRCGSFKDAAEELCVSQSAVSHQIKHLEKWLGQPLFDRSGHRPQPLERALVLSRAVNRSMQDVSTACHVAQGNVAAKALVIASIPSVAVCWLIPKLSQFQTRHPDIATRMVYAFHGQDLDFTQIDLAFVFANKAPDSPGFQTQLFQPGTSVPVCSPALYDTLDTSQLATSMIDAGLLHDSNVEGWTDWLHQSNHEIDLPVKGSVFEDFTLLRAAALAGQGIALCPLALISTDLASKRLVQLSDEAVNYNYNYYLIKRETSHPDAVTAREYFAAWVFDMLAHDSASASAQHAPA